ncbi:hypothetical protein T492DRAFT_1085015 [Pavlovales sp. CCMP2436]|nr:hypothetical protein T492DRAFT_1085015 [Pavlovales sp. CCMP2436]
MHAEAAMRPEAFYPETRHPRALHSFEGTEAQHSLEHSGAVRSGAVHPEAFYPAAAMHSAHGQPQRQPASAGAQQAQWQQPPRQAQPSSFARRFADAAVPLAQLGQRPFPAHQPPAAPPTQPQQPQPQQPWGDQGQLQQQWGVQPQPEWHVPPSAQPQALLSSVDPPWGRGAAVGGWQQQQQQQQQQWAGGAGALGAGPSFAAPNGSPYPLPAPYSPSAGARASARALHSAAAAPTGLLVARTGGLSCAACTPLAAFTAHAAALDFRAPSPTPPGASGASRGGSATRAQPTAKLQQARAMDLLFGGAEEEADELGAQELPADWGGFVPQAMRDCAKLRADRSALGGFEPSPLFPYAAHLDSLAKPRRQGAATTAQPRAALLASRGPAPAGAAQGSSSAACPAR